VGIHYRGKFYEFVPWNGSVSWRIEPWGYWQMSAETEDYAVELVGTTDLPGMPLRAPTRQGLIYACRDTALGLVTLRLWHRQGSHRELVVEATSTQCGLEVGGGPWESNWVGQSRSPLSLIAPISAGQTGS
jgi:tocopherol cyclase